jgi:hypothetical protein
MTKNHDTHAGQTEKSPARKPRDQETPQEGAAREEHERRAHREWMDRHNNLKGGKSPFNSNRLPLAASEDTLPTSIIGTRQPRTRRTK